MILNYKEPQLNIDQQLAVETISAIPRQSAVLVGAQYVSPGFESKFDKETFSSAGGLLPVSFSDGDEFYAVDPSELILKLDSASVKLFVENAEYDVIDYFSGEGGDYSNGMAVSPGNSPNIVITQEVLRAVNKVDLDERFGGRSVKVGDIAYVANSDEAGAITRRKVRGFVGEPIESSYGSDPDANNQDVGNGAGNPVQTAGGDGDIFSPVSPTSYYLNGGVNLANPGSDISAVNRNGLSVIVDGEVKAGVRISLRILSFNAVAGTGTMSITSTDGVISSAGTFELEDDQLTFNLAASSSLHGISTVVATAAIAGSPQPLTPGQIFAFTILTDYNPLSDTQVIIDSDNGYTGEYDNTFYLKVKEGVDSLVEGTAVLTAYDARGNFSPFDVSLDYGDTTPLVIPVGDGISFLFNTAALFATPQQGLRKNDIYFITAKAARVSSTKFTGLVLDGPAVATGVPVAMKLRAQATGEITQLNQQNIDFLTVSADKTEATYASALSWKIEERDEGDQYKPLIDEVGFVYLDWRAAKVPSATEKAIGIYSSNDLTQFGPAHVGNDIAFAAKTARNAAPDTTFFVLRTSGTSAENFTEALEKIENSDIYYALACISEDPNAFYATVDHAEAMSVKHIKNFRKVYFGVDSPGEFDLVSQDSSGVNLTATVTNYAGSNRYVAFENDIDLGTMDVAVGDIISIDGNRLVIAQIISENELLVTEASAPALAVSPALPLTIIKSNNPANQIYYVSRIAENTSNRRGSLIWCDKPIGFDTVQNKEIVVPVKYAAAEVAALRSVIAPQVGLTRQDISFIRECPNMYTKFTRNLLNTAAANGVMIITQENENGSVFVRHQLTTEVDKGLLYYEDSVTTNVDNISFQFKDVLDKYIGRKNVTATTLGLIAHEVFIILDNARKTTISNIDVGPQILEFYDENNVPGKVTVKQHPTFKDRVLVNVKVAIPTPLNILEVVIDAISETVTITE
jgi:hypothetical protein